MPDDQPGVPVRRTTRDRRVGELLGRMTIEERAAQITAVVLPPSGPGSAAARLDPPPGIVLVPPMPAVESGRRIADVQAAIAVSRSGIAALTISTAGADDAAFPGRLAAAASWDVALAKRSAAAHAADLRAAGILATTAFAAVSSTRGYVEADPVLAAAIVAADVHGAQGHEPGPHTPIGPSNVALAVSLGPPRDGTWHERTLRGSLLLAAETAVRAGATIVVPSSASNAGVPGHVDPWILSTVLRRTWGFQGVVMSAPGAIEELVSRYRVAESLDLAIAAAIEAGVTVVDAGPDSAARIAGLVRAGSLPRWLLDEAAASVLQLKIRLGIVRPAEPETVRRRHAPPVARSGPDPGSLLSSLVLLADPAGVLPLADRGVVHVSSFDDLAAGWRPDGPVDGSAPVNAVAEALATRLTACEVRTGMPHPGEDATGSTLVLLVDEPAKAAPIVGRAIASGLRCVVLLCSDRLGELAELAPTTATVLVCWRPVDGAGSDALADVLVGAAEPGGRLPVALPVDPAATKLVPLGHGSGYTRFTYSRLHIAPGVLLNRETIEIRCVVTNTGTRPGGEVVQAYLARRTGTIATDAPTLVGFAIVRLDPGQSATVTIRVPAERLAVWDSLMRHVLQPGAAEILLGGSARDIRLTGSITVESTVELGAAR